jgi:WD40 repeat protein
MKAGNLIKTIPLHTDQINCGCISPSGKYYAGGSNTGEINIWELSNSNIIQTFKDNASNVCCITWSPDEKLVFSGCSTGKIIAIKNKAIQ